MEKPKRARKRKPETSQGGPAATIHQVSGGPGVDREVESEGHEEKSRAVIDGGYPEDELVAGPKNQTLGRYGFRMPSDLAAQ